MLENNMADDRFKQWARTLEAEGRVPTIEEELAVRLREGHNLEEMCDEILKRKIVNKTITTEDLYQFFLLSEGYDNYLQNKEGTITNYLRVRKADWFASRKFCEKLLEGEGAVTSKWSRKSHLHYMGVTIEGRTNDCIVYNDTLSTLRFEDEGFFNHISNKYPRLEKDDEEEPISGGEFASPMFINLTREVMLGFYAQD